MRWFIVLTVLLLGTAPLLLGLTRLLTPRSWPGHGPLRIWHLLIAVALTGLFLAFLNASPHDQGPITFIAALVVLAIVLKVWRDEFVFLMSLRDNEFPGRYDKLVWIGMLTAFAPVGIWFFRTYHLTHWPEPVPEMASGKVVPEL